MNQLRGQLSLVEPPSTRQLNVAKGKFVTVWATMRKAEQLSQELATVKPDIAEELKADHDAMESFYTNMYLEIIRRVGLLE